MIDCEVIIPSCDRPESIRQSAASALVALAEAGRAGAVIVVDDGDNFPVQHALADVVASELRVKTNPGPKGPSAARNYGAAQAKSEILFFLDDDDLMEPDYIYRILAQRRSGSCTAVWGFSRVRDSRAYYGLPAHASMLGPDIPLRQRLTGIGTGFWIERAVFQRLGGLDQCLRINEDTDFCLTLASAGLMPWYEPQRGVKLDAARPAQGADRPSITKSARAAERAAAWKRILEKHATLLAVHPVERGIFCSRMAKFLARSGDVRGSLAVAFSQSGMARWQALSQAIAGAITRKK